MLYQVVTAMTRGQKQAVFTVIDALMVPLALAVSLLLQSSLHVNHDTLTRVLPLFAGATVVGMVIAWWLGLPRIKLNAYETRGIVLTAAFAATAGVAVQIMGQVMATGLTIGIYFNFTLVLLVLCATWRIVLRQVTIQIYRRGKNRKRVLIYGAGADRPAAGRRACALTMPSSRSPSSTTTRRCRASSISGLRVFARPASSDARAGNRTSTGSCWPCPRPARPALRGSRTPARIWAARCMPLPSFAQLVGDGELSKARRAGRRSAIFSGRNRLE